MINGLFSCATTNIASKAQDTSSTKQTLRQQEAPLSRVLGSPLTVFLKSLCICHRYTSCGDEVFDEELRLHTFKKHAHEHRKVFNDQLLTYRDNQLWFDALQSPRCVTISNNRLFLSTNASQCAAFVLLDSQQGFVIQERNSEKCMTLGNAAP